MKKFLSLLTIMLALTIGWTFTSFAATTFSDCWMQDAQGNWKVKNSDGSFVTNAWFCDDAVASNGKEVWYLLDATGNMITAGLVQDLTGNYYSLETEYNGYYGMLRNKSNTYGGIKLEIESSHNGAFASIKNQDGIDALKAVYGVTAINIGNDNCVYSSGIIAQQANSSVAQTTIETQSQGDPSLNTHEAYVKKLDWAYDLYKEANDDMLDYLSKVNQYAASGKLLQKKRSFDVTEGIINSQMKMIMTACSGNDELQDISHAAEMVVNFSGVGRDYFSNDIQYAKQILSYGNAFNSLGDKFTAALKKR